MCDLSKKITIQYSVKVVTKYCAKIAENHKKSINTMLTRKQQEGKKPNPNSTIWNLSGRVLSNDECEAPKHVLNTTQKMKFSIKDFFSKCDQIRSTKSEGNCGFSHIY